MNLKPFINSTTFGSITVGSSIYDYDIIIRSGGFIEKRKKKLSKKVYGTSHKISRGEAEFIYEPGLSKIIIGSGQYGALGLSDEAKNFFNNKQVELVLENTPIAIRLYNEENEPCAGMFHVTC